MDQSALLDILRSENILLASQSPRRSEILNYLSLPYRVVPADLDESLFLSRHPGETVVQTALAKAQKIYSMHPDSLVIAADTGVVAEEVLLGKPTDRAEAQRMLRILSGNRHSVLTGVAVVHPSFRISFWEESLVYFGHLSENDIAAYIETGSPFDKAGAYGIQEAFGARFIRRIEGDFFNVMGLPLHALLERLTSVYESL